MSSWMRCPKCKRPTLGVLRKGAASLRICVAGDCNHVQLVRDEKKHRDERGVTKRKLVR